MRHVVQLNQIQSMLIFRTARVEDLAFLDDLRRTDSQSLGFFSRTALLEKIHAGMVRVASLFGRRTGFIMHGSLRRAEVRLFQVAVLPDQRGLGIGRAMVEELLRVAAKAGAAGVSLRCRDRLPANGFWHEAGFELLNLESARRGSLYVWVRRVRKEGQARNAAFEFHSRWHDCPNCGVKTCGAWVKGGVRRALCATCVKAVLAVPVP